MALVIADYAQAIKVELEAVLGAAPDDQKLLDFCTALAKANINYWKANADLNLLASAINVDAGTFTNAAGAVTGVGVTQAVVIAGKIQ